MSDAADEKVLLKEKSTLWGWFLLVGWIVFWWWQLKDGKNSDIAARTGWNMFWAFVTAPVAFFIAPHIAKWDIQQDKDRETLAEKVRVSKQQAEEKKLQQAHETALDDFSKRNLTEQQAARASGERYEIITRLGAVDDQLVVLDKEKNPENIKLIKLSIGQSIRDIHAKFKDEELRAMYAADVGVRQRVDRTLAEMRRLRMAKSRFHADLSSMFHQPHAHDGER